MITTKRLSIILGVISLTFGILKFVSPFKDWYSTQIETSGLPHFAYALGIGGEITIGIAFLLPFIVSNISLSLKGILLIFAHVSLMIMMLGAAVIHLIPAVPAEALPLKIKPPIIPLTFGIVAFFNLIKTVKGNEK